MWALGKLENAVLEMKKHKMDILGIVEIRWAGSGSRTKDDYLVLYSGGDQHTILM